MNGTAKRDVIRALGGDDVVNALGGNDRVCAGGGNDKVKGRAPNDQSQVAPAMTALSAGAVATR